MGVPRGFRIGEKFSGFCFGGLTGDRSVGKACRIVVGGLSASDEPMKFSEFRRHKPKPGQNVFVMACSDEFLIDESQRVWASAFSGNWVVEKLHLKEFEEIEANRLTDDALTP